MAKSAVVIDGVEHEIPELASFDMNELQILFDLSNLTVPDFSGDEDDPAVQARIERHYWNPGFQRTLMVVAVMRANPGMNRAKAEELVGKVKPLDALKFEEDEASPPEQAPSSSGGDVESSESQNAPSGTALSAVSAVHPAEIREVTGTSGLVTPPDFPRAA